MLKNNILWLRNYRFVMIPVITLFVSACVATESQRVTRSVSKSTVDAELKVAGVVRNQAGRVVEGAVLQVFSAGNRVTSDSRGGFEARWRRSMVHTEQEPYLMAWHIKRNLTATIIIDESGDDIEVTLKPGIVLTGQVTNNSGKPIPNAEVFAVVRLGRWSSIVGDTVKADTKGRFAVNSLPQWHELQVYAGADGYGRSNVVVPEHTATGEPQDVGILKLNPANLSVSGKVIDANDQPVVNATIRVEGKGQPKIRNIRPDKEGRFLIQGVCEGPLELYVSTLTKPRMYARLESHGGATDAMVILEPLDVSERSSSAKQDPILGKNLPDIKELGIDLKVIKAKNVSILICFFDMQQRPSRNCIMQLSKRAQELAAKDVVVVAIQASIIDKSTLDEWMKENNIPFPIGMIQGDEETARFAWGIRSLPWLILTDKSHLVISNGFSLSELGSKIEASQK